MFRKTCRASPCGDHRPWKCLNVDAFQLARGPLTHYEDQQTLDEKNIVRLKDRERNPTLLHEIQVLLY